MLTRFVAETARLCNQDHAILLAISGGVDSMAMLNLFHEAGFAIGVAHCNFQLRDEASDGDEQFVQGVCAQLNIPFYSKRFDTKNYAAEKGASIQIAARELRYTWFSELMEKNNYDQLATAHHLNDSMETTLLNLVRGTGLSGLRGIPPVNGYIIRPLLSFTKEELVNYAKANQIEWREDVSNETDDYDRNFLRHQVIPKLQELNPSLEESFKKTNKRLLGGEVIFQLGLQHLRITYVKESTNRLTISKTLLTETQFPEVVIWELIKNYGFNFTQCLEAVLAVEQSGKIFLSNSHQLVVDRKFWILGPRAIEREDIIIDIGSKKAMVANQEITLEITTNKELPDVADEAKLDADKITFPITWRRWKEGDFFYPLGLKKRKKLSDFFIDNKIPLSDKQQATVLEANGDIIWVVGYRIDNRYKITHETSSVLQLKIHSLY